MTELYGWAGEILRVNLSTGKISTVDTTKYVPKYLGGRGVAERVAWEEIGPEVGAFDPANLLMFMAGPLTGTLAPTSGRGEIFAVSPRTYPEELFTRSGIGGWWAPELKYAGYDGVIVKGKADKPVYLLIEDDQVTVEDAKDVWGLGAIATQQLLKKKHGERTQVIAIGQAGEHLVRIATIQHNLSNSAGQPGFGAVMGSKNLKAVAFRGTGSLKIASPETFLKNCMDVHKLVAPGLNWISIVGSPVPSPGTVPCSAYCAGACTGMKKDIPAVMTSGTLNMMEHCVDPVYRTGWDRTEYPTKYYSFDSEIKTRPTPGFPGVDLQNLGEDLGVNGWAAMANIYPWIGVLIDHGVTELNGFKLDIDNPKWWYEFLRMLAYREGIGNIFADGLMRVSDELDELGVPEGLRPLMKKVSAFEEPAWGHSSHRIGRAAESQPSPLWILGMLHWIVDTRDPLSSTHLYSWIEYILPGHHGCPQPVANVPFEKLKALFQKVFGDGEIIEPGFEPVDGKVKAALWGQKRSALKDSLIVCDWVFPRMPGSFETQEELDKATDIYGDLDAESKMFSPCTGIDMSTADLEKAAERICNLDRALQVRNYGRDRAKDSAIEWYFELPEKSDGTKLDKPMFNMYLDECYKQKGWDKNTGWPTRTKLEELDLKDVADELESIGKLP